jgi:hypothetical protein
MALPQSKIVVKKAKLYFINMSHKGTVRRLFNIDLSQGQTVVSSPLALMKPIHITHHQAKPDEARQSISQVREYDRSDRNTRTLLRVPQSTKLVDLVSIFVDADQLGTSKEFRKKSYDEQYTLQEDFGDYLTFQFFQGRGREIGQELEAKFNAKSITYLVPNGDGVDISPGGTSKTNTVNCVRLVFDPDEELTVGVLVAGVARDFELLGSRIPKSEIKFVALGEEGMRFIRK